MSYPDPRYQGERSEGEVPWSVPVLAEGGTPDPSYFQIGGAPSRAHDGTNPGHPLSRETSKLGRSIKFCNLKCEI